MSPRIAMRRPFDTRPSPSIGTAAEHVERGGHGGGVGVEGVVDHVERQVFVRDVEPDALACRGRRWAPRPTAR
jgi:hypothetical protein